MSTKIHSSFVEVSDCFLQNCESFVFARRIAGDPGRMISSECHSSLGTSVDDWKAERRVCLALHIVAF